MKGETQLSYFLGSGLTMLTRLVLNSWAQAATSPPSIYQAVGSKCRACAHSGLAVSRSSTGVSCRQRARHARTSRTRATTRPPPTAPSAPLMAGPPLPPSSSTASPQKVRHESQGRGESQDRTHVPGKAPQLRKLSYLAGADTEGEALSPGKANRGAMRWRSS